MVKNSENQLSAMHPSGGGGTPHFKWQGGVRDFGGFEIHDLGISVVLHNHSVI